MYKSLFDSGTPVSTLRDGMDMAGVMQQVASATTAAAKATTRQEYGVIATPVGLVWKQACRQACGGQGGPRTGAR